MTEWEMSVDETCTIAKTREMNIEMVAPNGVTRETVHVDVYRYEPPSAAYGEFALVDIAVLESMTAELSDLRTQHGALTKTGA